MILPHPDSNLSNNLMVVGADIVQLLSRLGRKDNFVLVDDLLRLFLKKNAKRNPEMFLHALTFLFAMDAIEKKGYRIKLISQNISKKQNTQQLTLF